MDQPQDPGNGHRRQRHRHDQLGRPPPVVGDEDRISEDHRQHPQHAALDRGQDADRVVLAHAAQHQDILRGHEEDDDQREQASPRTSEAGGASASIGWKARRGSGAAGPASSRGTGRPAIRIRSVQDQRPDEKQAEADDQDQRRGPQPLLKQPARLGRQLRPAPLDHPLVGDEAVGRRGTSPSSGSRGGWSSVVASGSGMRRSPEIG